MKTFEENLRQYCQYLINEYSKINKGTGGNLMSKLKQFHEEGRVKDLFEKRARKQTKINFLNIFRDEILFFANSQSKKIVLKSYNEFYDSNY